MVDQLGKLGKAVTGLVQSTNRLVRKHVSMSSILCLLAVVVGALLLGQLLGVFTSGGVEGYEGQKELLLLHMEGCPHCIKLMPEWNAFASENDTGIGTRAIERKEAPSLLQKYGVTSFPTVLLVDGSGNKLSTYDGARTKTGLLQFCRENS